MATVSASIRLTITISLHCPAHDRLSEILEGQKSIAIISESQLPVLPPLR